MIIFFFTKIGAHDAFEMPLTLELYRSYTRDHKYNGLEDNNIYIFLPSLIIISLKYKCMKVKNTWVLGFNQATSEDHAKALMASQCGSFLGIRYYPCGLQPTYFKILGASNKLSKYGHKLRMK
jgi:hypothetical protein